MTPSLLTDEIRELVGTSSVSEHRVIAEDFQNWARLVGIIDVIHFDTDAAYARGFRGLVMPSLYLPHLTRSGPIDPSLLGPDGRRQDAASGVVELPGLHRVRAGGEEYTFHELLCAADLVSVTRTVHNITEKEGRAEPFLLVETLTEFHLPTGLAATFRQTVVALP